MMRKFFNIKSLILILCVLFLASSAWAGTPKEFKYGLKLKDITALGTPLSGYGYLYVTDDVIYFKTDGGVATNLLTATSVTFNDISNPDGDTALTFANDEISVWTFADINEDMFTIQGIGAFGDVSIVKIEQKTGLATDGTVLEVVSADTDVDALLVTANGVDVILVNGDGTLTLTGDTGLTGDLTITGGLSVSGTLGLDAIAATTATQTLTLDGNTTGGVTIGSTSTGNVTLGDTVVVSDGYNATIGEGSLTIDNDSTSETALTITSDSTTAGGAINIVSKATTTNGKVISVTADNLTTGDMLYLDSTADGLTTGNYIHCYDGAATDFEVGLYLSLIHI